jgi:hypothetical protein
LMKQTSPFWFRTAWTTHRRIPKQIRVPCAELSRQSTHGWVLHETHSFLTTGTGVVELADSPPASVINASRPAVGLGGMKQRPKIYLPIRRQPTNIPRLP